MYFEIQITAPIKVPPRRSGSSMDLDGFHREDPEDVDVGAPASSTINQPLLLSRSRVDPPPCLDVLSFHSTRLLSESQQEIAAHELLLKQKHGLPSYSTPSKSKGSVLFTPEEEAARLDDLLSSLHLLLEPIQLPDLSHTGIFNPTTSLLRPATPTVAIKPESESVTKLKLGKLDKNDEIKLFYPTGAKNSNMRDYIKETIQKHFSTANLEQPLHDKCLGTSKSAPIFYSPGKMTRSNGTQHAVSPSKPRKSVKKKNKMKSIKSPVKMSLGSGALLNPQLTRQAKDIIAAVRANSSKINDLISK